MGSQTATRANTGGLLAARGSVSSTEVAASVSRFAEHVAMGSVRQAVSRILHPRQPYSGTSDRSASTSVPAGGPMDADVLVVGAGPAGLAVAAWPAQRG